MSSVTFNSPSGSARLHGSERAYAGCHTYDIALGALNLDSFGIKDRIMPFVTPGHYLHTTDESRWRNTFETCWRVGYSDLLEIDGVVHDPWHLTLNTAIVAGSDAINWLARMHATCEIHGYVEGPHREWLADIIAQGRADKVLRSNMGWEDVIDLLRSNYDEPVVMSYSVCDGFPNPSVSDWADVKPKPETDQYGELDDDEEAEWENWMDLWYELPADEKWQRSMNHLRDTREGDIDLHPGMWRTRGFGSTGWSVYDLTERLYAD